jgi:drug/metabolite transporter (DMT)-like permease
MVVGMCFIFNLAALFFLLDALGLMETPDIEGMEWLVGLVVLGLFAFYFLWNKGIRKSWPGALFLNVGSQWYLLQHFTF